MYVLVSEERVRILDAGDLWGRDTYETDRKLKEIHGENIVVSSIGPAGKSL